MYRVFVSLFWILGNLFWSLAGFFFVNCGMVMVYKVCVEMNFYNVDKVFNGLMMFFIKNNGYLIFLKLI